MEPKTPTQTMGDLKDTVDMMLSKDYKDRFRAEYHQVRIRRDKLKEMIDKWDNDRLDFIPTCPRSIYDLQLRAMNDYIAILETRGVIENALPVIG